MSNHDKAWQGKTGENETPTYTEAQASKTGKNKHPPTQKLRQARQGRAIIHLISSKHEVAKKNCQRGALRQLKRYFSSWWSEQVIWMASWTSIRTPTDSREVWPPFSEEMLHYNLLSVEFRLRIGPRMLLRCTVKQHVLCHIANAA
eukprot:5177223-Amphidinium_carterae.2